MVFTDRPYALSERGHEIVDESGILDAMRDSSVGRSSQSISEHYLRSPQGDTAEEKEVNAMRYMYFEALEYAETEEQKQEIKKIFQDFLNAHRLQLSWRVESDTETSDTLFGPVPKVIKDIPLEPRYDAALLSGLEAAELFDEAPDIPEMLLGKYFTDYLGAAAFVGAVLLSDRRPQYSMTETIGEKRARQITCGGDMHGDFRIHITSYYDRGSTSPFGKHVEFAPHVESETLMAYHSVEPNILLGALHYFEDCKLTAREQGFILKNILKETEDANPGAGPFGDFGDDALGQQIHSIQNEERWRLDALSPLKGFFPFQDIVIPGNENLHFRVRSDGDEFVVENFCKDGSQETRQLRFNVEQTAKFLAMLINSGGGRTYHGTLQSMIKARLEVLGETS